MVSLPFIQRAYRLKTQEWQRVCKDEIEAWRESRLPVLQSERVTESRKSFGFQHNIIATWHIVSWRQKFFRWFHQGWSLPHGIATPQGTALSSKADCLLYSRKKRLSGFSFQAQEGLQVTVFFLYTHYLFIFPLCILHKRTHLFNNR